LILPTLITFILLPLWIYLYATLHLMIFFIITLVTALVSVGWVAWVVFDWSNDYSIITSRRVLFQEKSPSSMTAARKFPGCHPCG